MQITCVKLRLILFWPFLVSFAHDLQVTECSSLKVREYVAALPDAKSSTLSDLIAAAGESAEDIVESKAGSSKHNKQKKTIYYPDVSHMMSID